MMKEGHRQNELVELHFQGLDVKFPRHVVTFQVRVYCVSSGHKYMAGETEFVAATHNPVFKKAIRLDYLPNNQQTLEIHCADSSNPTLPTLGETDIEFGVVIDSEEGITLPLLTADQLIGQIFVEYKPIVDDKSSYHVGFNCINVKNLEFFSKSDPFIKMYRPSDIYINSISKDDIPERGWILLHQTEFHKHDLNPKFRPFAISKWNLCRGNLDALIKFEIWDHSKFTMHRKISISYTTTNRILNETDKFLNTFDEKEKFGGTICFNMFEEKKFYMFDQYMEAGVQLRLVIAIDCSGSTKGLHNTGAAGKSNHFESAIREVGSILIPKEKTHRFGFLGFGAKLNGSKHPSFAFNHEKSERNLSVNSVDEAIELYRKVYPKIEPEEPTNLSAVLDRIRMMMKHQDKKNYKIYTLMVIMTDGDITDRQDTVDKIVECASYPLSVVVLGIGQGNFDFMEFLETGQKMKEPDNGKKKKKEEKEKGSPQRRKVARLKSSNGKEAYRRIVRFVNYHNYNGKQTELEEAILRDVPRQMTEFYTLMNFNPSADPNADQGVEMSPANTV